MYNFSVYTLHSLQNILHRDIVSFAVYSYSTILSSVDILSASAFLKKALSFDSASFWKYYGILICKVRNQTRINKEIRCVDKTHTSVSGFYLWRSHWHCPSMSLLFIFGEICFSVRIFIDIHWDVEWGLGRGRVGSI